MGIYLDNGYLNINQILSYGVPFNFIVGGRGTGKTYGTLKTAYIENKRFILMRRTQAQCDLINKPEFNPFKALNNDTGSNAVVKSISKYNAKIVEETEEDERLLGYTCALSTIANMRGFDASDVELLIYDEFIPEKHERAIKNEGSAFLNAYETINRNREIKGEKPLQVLCLANAFNIANPIFLELGLVGRCEKMKNSGQEIFIDKERGVCVVLLQKSKISKAKADTALYRLSSGSYADMALSNDFVYNNSDNIKSMALKEFKLLCTVGEISIYKHKSKRLFYVSEHRTGTAPIYKSDEVNLQRYRKNHGVALYGAYMRNNIICESLLTKSLFELYTL
ncbi:MAG: phage DNA encapsidation protein [Methanobrevibacter sp.]|nr:phage DNA encapsidation protein [Methanobrevibacter sp.]